MRFGQYELDLTSGIHVMGILNVTPDSFSDGGKYNELDAAMYRVEEMIEEGAAIIDIGGESTRPGHVQITAQEEIERVVPVLEAINSRFDIPVSVDTYKAEVAQVCCEHGAGMINDIWGGRYSEFYGGESILPILAKYPDISVCLMHNRPGNKPYSNYPDDVISDLSKAVESAVAAGIDRSRIVTDPGVGFAKDLSQNLMIMNQLELLQKLGCPILLGTSRKSMIGNTLNLPVTERVEGTLVTTVMGIMKGASILRVHDVKENVRAVKMTQAILESGRA